MRFIAIIFPGEYSTKLGDSLFENKKEPKSGPDYARVAEEMTRMGQFNDELEKAGVLLSVDGLLPKKFGTRIGFAGGEASVTDGPFIETKEVVGGFWTLKAKSKQEIIDLFKRCPAQPDDVIEIRQIAELADFPEEIQSSGRE